MTKVPEKRYRILIVDDDDDILRLLEKWLTADGFEVIKAVSSEEALEILESTRPNLVISDIFMGGMNGLDLLARIREDNPLLPVIMLSGQAKIPDAVKATHLGSAAFLTKPVKHTELREQVKRALRIDYDFPEGDELRKKLVFQSRKMEEVIDLAMMVADSNVTVFISGATGTGKEVIARAIHDASPRRNRPFIAVNCAAIPEQLLESELFGHEKGAFTGAATRNEGLFQAAGGGTLFLDEIGDMPLSLQVKLLRVLQDFEVRPVGSTKSYPVDVRIISATHRNIEASVREGEFREDLYYRLKVVPIEIPPLDERREDIPLLASHFLQAYSDSNNKKLKYFSPDAMEYLMSASWPGNIRQLLNVIDLCATLCKTETIPISLVRKVCSDKPESFITLKEARQEFERNYLVGVLRVTSGNVANATKIAGRNRTEFYKLLNQYDIDPAEFRQSGNR
ncbi:MAG: sigma-54 dependent transcriptional regulator [Gammaproteobacteria bacterium]